MLRLAGKTNSTAAAETLSEAMARMIADVDYSNFKHEVARMQGQKRSILYREVWACS